MSSSKERYRQLCAEINSIPLFCQDWYLDATAGEHWDVALVESHGVVLGAMPYLSKQKMGLTVLTQPPHTQFLGPWLRPGAGKYGNQLAQQKEVMNALIDQLPPFDYFTQSWNPLVSNWLPFYWRGFQQTTRYTYVIEDITDVEQVLDDFSSSYKNKIRKARKLVEVKRGLDIERFHTINSLTFQRQGLVVPYTLESLRCLDERARARQRREIFYAQDPQGHIHSALYLMWDDSRAYVRMVGEDPELRNSGAGILLIAEAIRFSSQELRLGAFDFEGSMLESVERVRRDCGGRQVPFHAISKVNSKWLAFFLLLKSLRSR